jgi:hypothetical protein
MSLSDSGEVHWKFMGILCIMKWLGVEPALSSLYLFHENFPSHCEASRFRRDDLSIPRCLKQPWEQ